MSRKKRRRIVMVVQVIVNAEKTRKQMEHAVRVVTGAPQPQQSVKR